MAGSSSSLYEVRRNESTGYTGAFVSRTSIFAPNLTPGTVSLTNRWSDYTAGHPKYKGSYREGGNWLGSGVDYEVGASQIKRYSSDSDVGNPQYLLFSGWFYGIVVGFTPSAGVTTDTDAQSVSFGTKAISQVEPTNPSVGLSVATAELAREGVPSLIGRSLTKERIKDFRDLQRKGGSEYLNYQFGWAPVVSDARSFAKTVLRHDRLYNSYIAGQDKPIHRRLDVREETQGNSKTGQAIPVPSELNITGSGTATSSVENLRWFEGCFRYHIPTGPSQAERMQRYASLARKLYGVELTPEVLWNLSPWSWAFDWFADTGAVAHNISALGKDGLVMQYGYAMHSSDSKVRHMCKFTLHGRDYYTSYTITNRSRKRVTAHPYGFGISDVSLTARQKGVIAALAVQPGGSRIR
jgi:hypothetical protein